jgi:hypothetical protein
VEAKDTRRHLWHWESVIEIVRSLFENCTYFFARARAGLVRPFCTLILASRLWDNRANGGDICGVENGPANVIVFCQVSCT